ncbi:MAG TPA: selenocysteine-specific translation elongation factor [Bryobacteraceae bacterium]|jgi:selenocysteine-specific elongation factor|nr:selenocysteine-specific translation elongation factor [Bryobacteraceae bacterium]
MTKTNGVPAYAYPAGSGGGIVFGTAGHIDHGKTSLVQALTGIDTDRLAEEKRRGISIDLGFAHLLLDDGRTVALVDVPGHERFIKNMLAGVGGIQAVLLVVAADESVKPQTREHFEICRLLGIEHGIVVLTKADLAGGQRFAQVQADVAALCAGSFLEKAPVVAVSALTGAGLDHLKLAMAALATRIAPRSSIGLARLPIDRSFTIAGFGAVVTGTLWNGQFNVGDEVEVHPEGHPARIRGLQIHGHIVSKAVAGQRTAINLAGIDSQALLRGQVLTHRGGLGSTQALDAVIEWLPGQQSESRRIQAMLHAGTMEMTAAVKILTTGEPVGRGAVSSPGIRNSFVRVRTSQSWLALPGDRFVLRALSPQQTIAGGTVVDPFPPLRFNRAKTLSRLAILQPADAPGRIRFLIDEGIEGRRVPDLVRATGLSEAEVLAFAAADPQLVFHALTRRVLAQSWLDDRNKRLLQWLKEFHAQNPAAAGAPLAQARLGLGPALAALLMNGNPELRVAGETVALAAFRPRWNDRQSKALDAIERAYRVAAYQPPTPQEALKLSGVDPGQARALLESLIKEKKLVRISAEMIFHFDAIDHIRKSLGAHKGLTFSVPQFKEWTQISRKYAIPLLEYLDREHVTRREGDNRVIL